MARFVRVAKTDEIPEGSGKYFDVEGEPIAIFHVGDNFYATSDICTHEEASLSEGELEGEIVECAMHGARFNVRTGAVLALPAVTRLQTFPVRVVGNDIEVEVE
ncbi:MAG TPA: non-heme iron oxygenase ferredoxin subunit [Chloroflexota bacterium]|jgi:3-phenylpropionate/trans-cinnamate dioxygenase ferredoxin subunit|nr:non-heme iron oxygenase ferredoxin subunit [Chloroflexota bacterium]